MALFAQIGNKLWKTLSEAASAQMIRAIRFLIVPIACCGRGTQKTSSRECSADMRISVLSRVKARKQWQKFWSIVRATAYFEMDLLL